MMTLPRLSEKRLCGSLDKGVAPDGGGLVSGIASALCSVVLQLQYLQNIYFLKYITANFKVP